MRSDSTTARAKETSVRDALAAFTSQQPFWATSPTILGRVEARHVHPREWPIVAVVVLSLLAFGVVLVAEYGSTSCHTSTYGFTGDPPEMARAEFRQAAHEIQLRTGLHFEEVDSHFAELLVTWLPEGLTAHVPPDSGFDPKTETPVGSASARWEGSTGVRRLDSARIEIDGSHNWGSPDRPGVLRAVFIHELGHVLGLAHSADPASYMHPRVRSAQGWTAENLTELARLGELSGCGPPLTSA